MLLKNNASRKFFFIDFHKFCKFICVYPTRAENFRMVDIGINAWSSLFDNLKINIILQDYLKSVWKTIKFKLIFNYLRNCSSQSEKSGQPMREQKYSHWRKQGYPRREKKSGLRTKMKNFHSGYSDQEVRIRVYPF